VREREFTPVKAYKRRPEIKQRPKVMNPKLSCAVLRLTGGLAAGLVLSWNALATSQITAASEPWAGFAQAVVLDGTNAFVAAGEAGLLIFDVSQSAAPALVGQCASDSYVFDVALAGNYAFVLDYYYGLTVFDVRNRAQPTPIGGDAALVATDLAVVGNYAYLVDSEAGLVVLDVSNPVDTLRVGQCEAVGAYGVVVAGHYAYVTAEEGLLILDVSNPAKPSQVGKHPMDYAMGVAVGGSYAYVTDYVMEFEPGLEIINVSDPAKPVGVSQWMTDEGAAWGITVKDNYLFLAEGAAGLEILDVSRPGQPVLAGQCALAGEATAVAVSGTNIYVASGSAGLVTLNLDRALHGVPEILWAPQSQALVSGQDASFEVACSGTLPLSFQWFKDGAPLTNDLRIEGATNAMLTISNLLISDAGHYQVVVSNRFGQVASSNLLLSVRPGFNPVLAGTWPGYERGTVWKVVAQGNYAFAAASGAGLVVFDVSDPAAPRYAGACESGGWAYDVALAGSYAYVADEYEGLKVIDIRDPLHPVLAGQYETTNYPATVVIAGQYAYLADPDAGIEVIDISQPENPVCAGSYACSCAGLAVAGKYAYLADSDRGLLIVDVSHPAQPVLVGSYTNQDASAYAVAVVGQYAYVAFYQAKVQIIDVSNPAKPTLVEGYTPGVDVSGFWIAGNYLYMAAGYTGLEIYDVTNPAQPRYEWDFKIGGNARSVTVAGPYAYVATEDGNWTILKVPQWWEGWVSSYPANGWANDLAISGNYAFVADGSALTSLDVSNPVQPLLLTGISTGSPVDFVAVRGAYAYVAGSTCAGEFQVFDVSDPVHPVCLNEWPLRLTGTVHGLAVSGNYAYVAEGDWGVELVDLRDPATPWSIGFYDISPAQAVQLKDDYAFLATTEAGVQIFDVHDPLAPVFVGLCPDATNIEHLVVQGNYVYATDGGRLIVIDISNPASPTLKGTWVSDDYLGALTMAGHFALVAGYEGTHVIDVSDPANPAWVGKCNSPGQPHALTVAGQHVLVAQGSCGVAVLDLGQAFQAPPKLEGYPQCLALGEAKDLHLAINVSGSLPVNFQWIKEGIPLADDRWTKGATSATLEIKPYVSDTAGTYWLVASNVAGISISSKIVVSVARIINPERLSQWPVQPRNYGNARGVVVVGNYAYLADADAGLQVIDVRDPHHPEQVGSFDTPGSAYSVAVAGHWAYVADGEAGLQVIDVSDPAKPVRTGTYDTPGVACAVVTAGHYAYVGDSEAGLQVIDVSNPAWPVRVGKWSQINSDGSANAVAIVGNHLYVANGRAGVWVFDVSNPAKVAPVGVYSIGSEAKDVAVAGHYAYIADFDLGLLVLDISDPAKPVLMGRCSRGDWAGDWGDNVSVVGDFALLSIHSWDLGYIDIIDVSNPATPRYQFSHSPKDFPYDMAISGDYAFVAEGARGLEVLGLDRLKIRPISPMAKGWLIQFVSDADGAHNLLRASSPLGPWSAIGVVGVTNRVGRFEDFSAPAGDAFYRVSRP
jgi:hypothetical protein